MRGGGFTTCCLSLLNAALLSVVHFTSLFHPCLGAHTIVLQGLPSPGSNAVHTKMPPGPCEAVLPSVMGSLIVPSLASLMESIPSPITCPKKSICLSPKVHFSGLRSVSTFWILWRTFRNRWRCSAHVVPPTNMSSR